MRRVQTVISFTLLSAFALWAIQLPAGKQVRVRLGQTISSAKARSGDKWDGTLASDLVVNGQTVAAKGSEVRGKVVEAKESGRLHAPGILKLQLTSIRINGAQTMVRSSTVSRQGKSHKTRDGEAIGGGAAAGAIIGAIAGGGKGAAIGAGAGVAAGTVGAAATGKKEATYPVETVLTFTLR